MLTSGRTSKLRKKNRKAGSARALGGEVRGGQILAPGPGHSPKDRSLRIKLDANAPDGFLVHSFADDDPIACRDHVRAKAGLPAFAPNGHKRARVSEEEIEKTIMAAMAAQADEPPKGRIVNLYDYTDEAGVLLYQVARLEPKDFRHRRPDGKGGWIWKLGDVRRVVYRLPELLQHPHATVSICEGEKDSDRLASLGHCATTVASGTWSGVDVSVLAGRDVFVLADADETGTKKALAAAKAVHGVAATIRIIRMPDGAKDVSAWLDADASRAARLVEHCVDTPLWEPEAAPAEAAAEEAPQAPNEPPPISSLDERDAGDDPGPIPPRGWLLGNQFCRKFLSSITAPGGTGKTALRMLQFISLATGRPLTGQHVFRRCRVLLLSFEDDTQELQRRITAALVHHKIDRSELKGWLFYAAPKNLKLAEMRNGTRQIGKLEKLLREAIERRRPDIICLDPFVKVHALEENDNGAMDFVCDILAKLAIEHDLALDAPHHTRKGLLAAGDADSGRGASGIRDAARLVYTLTRMNEDEAKMFGISEGERQAYIRLDSAKVNITPAAQKATWFKLVSVRLDNGTEQYPNGDEVQTVEWWTPPETWANLSTATLNAALSEIDAGMSNGQRYSDANAARERAAWTVIQRHCPDKTEPQCREIVRTWVKNGVLYREDYDDPIKRDTRPGLRLDATMRPT